MLQIRTKNKIKPKNTSKMVAYSCSLEEEELFKQYAKEHGIKLIITSQNISEETAGLSLGCRCISINHSTKVTVPLLDTLYKNGVRYISTRTVGYDHIDIEHANKIGMYVGNVRYSPNSVADYTIMLILMVIRQAKLLLKRTDVQNYSLPEKAGREIQELTVGVIGTGVIGSTVISHLKGFGCKILAYDLYPNEEVCKYGEYVDLDVLLQKSDVITLHMPATKDNYHIIDKENIGKMKRNAVIINTGRGSLVNTTALIEAIEEKKLGGAALDVIENETGLFYENYRGKPLANKEIALLNSFSNVIITPHMAFYTEQAVREMVNNSIRSCIQFEKNSRKVWVNMAQ
ncbi:D-specific alpha-keto acid dehydrogenase [Clostridium tepidiprofundi DSM 19306]|uniref:D-specific alpha-keto acid dehydrogenase n=1 Tax=Clostridium tepidiprofundi DSM 19306 TaxID=1121338 RepID=A0A151AS79_9CLOT|nr:D-isomer specific 2-hydroxyacid dehydrogenase family protein [Clostridium tepidiprofundi]KYH30440.1 D-specific alpha-keto acid dehydrogenase [Clostridium tepidiprofundi DSM 19306]